MSSDELEPKSAWAGEPCAPQPIGLIPRRRTDGQPDPSYRCGPRRAGRGRLPPGSGAVSDDDSAAALGAVVWASVAGELVGGAAALATTAVPPRASTAGTAAIASLFLQFYIDA